MSWTVSLKGMLVVAESQDGSPNSCPQYACLFSPQWGGPSDMMGYHFCDCFVA